MNPMCYGKKTTVRSTNSFCAKHLTAPICRILFSSLITPGVCTHVPATAHL
nr:MAG TPA: hypothetical protein [Caudoviricetes sp.]